MQDMQVYRGYTNPFLRAMSSRDLRPTRQKTLPPRKVGFQVKTIYLVGQKSRLDYSDWICLYKVDVRNVVYIHTHVTVFNSKWNPCL